MQLCRCKYFWYVYLYLICINAVGFGLILSFFSFYVFSFWCCRISKPMPTLSITAWPLVSCFPVCKMPYLYLVPHHRIFTYSGFYCWANKEGSYSYFVPKGISPLIRSNSPNLTFPCQAGKHPECLAVWQITVGPGLLVGSVEFATEPRIQKLQRRVFLLVGTAQGNRVNREVALPCHSSIRPLRINAC